MRDLQPVVQIRRSVRLSRHHRAMFQVSVVCSSCAEESEVVVEDLDEVGREVCGCGYSYVVLSVAEFEAVEIEGGQVIELRRRSPRRLAA